MEREESELETILFMWVHFPSRNKPKVGVKSADKGVPRWRFEKLDPNRTLTFSSLSAISIIYSYYMSFGA
jgi:hypothetical protein